MRIGVAISTQNRRELFNQTVKHWLNYMPPGAVIVAVDDASDDPLPPTPGVHVVRHHYRRGVAMTKNRCIAELIDAGADHLFLADDDVHPTVDHWWEPYVHSPEPHLCHQWPSDPSWRIVHDDGEYFSIEAPRGVMLYAERRCIDTVGGMNPAFGAWGAEHIDWSNRIHHAGLTRWPYADVCGSDALWYAHDKNENMMNSTIPLIDRHWMISANQKILNHPRPLRIPYREWVGFHDYTLGPQLSDEPGGVLDHVLLLKPHGVALEFGVGAGGSLRRIARQLFTYGFDSFNGLPEKWRDGFDAGRFACPPPEVPNTHLVQGLFEATLPLFDLDPIGPVGLVHIDCDLYSSTRTVLQHMEPVFQPGTYVVFDEWHGYPGAESHEQKAWREFATRTRTAWTVIGHGPEQFAIRIT